MRDKQFSNIEQMIFAARDYPEPSSALRRQALAKSVRAYHERAQRRRVWVAAALLFGVIWTAGSAQRLLAQPARAFVVRQQTQLEDNADSMAKSADSHGDEWGTVERSFQSRFKQSRILRAALGTPTIPGS